MLQLIVLTILIGSMLWRMIWTTIISCADFSYSIHFFKFPNKWKWTGGIVSLCYIPHSHNFESILSLICIPTSSIPIRYQGSFTDNFRLLKEQEFFFIWGLFEEDNILKLHILRCNNKYLFICHTEKYPLPSVHQWHSYKPAVWSFAWIINLWPRGRFSVQSLSGDVPAFWYNNDPLFSAKTGIDIGHIFKIF